MAIARPRRRRVVTTYTPEQIRDTFERWLTQHEPSDDGEMRMYCPLCEDRDTSHSASASINPGKGEWNCLKTADHGGKIDALARELRVEVRGARRAVAAPAKSGLPPALEDQDKPLAFHDRLIGGERPDFLDFLTNERGLHVETLEHFKVGTDSERITIPVRVRGKWRNVRRYLPHADGPNKMLNLPGFGTVALAYVETFRGNTLPVIVTEGELDAILLWQEASGRLGVATGTGGAGNVPRDLSALAGREVFVAYDLDDAGRAGAEKFATEARKAGATAHVLDLARLNLRGKGADVSDYLLQHGGSVDALVAEMDRLRSADPDAGDEIDAAMHAAFLELGAPRRDYSASLLSEDQILDAPPQRNVVDPWIPRGMFSAGFGQPGSFKTTVAQDMQNSVRAGIDWHGHAVECGAVLLLEAEGVQQLQPRIVAWNEHHGYPDLAPFRALDVPLDLSTPEGAAALVRTVRGMEAATGERVVLVWVDPAALYMSTGENDDGNRNLALGLNAVAKYLDIGVLLIVHTNAVGDRARGTDHFRMLSGSYFKVERLEDGAVGVVQEKVKNTYPHAVILRPVPVGSSLAFDTQERMSAAEYAAQRDRSAWNAKTTHRLSEARAVREVKTSHAEALVLAALTGKPRQSTSQIRAATKNQGVGTDGIGQALAALVDRGEVSTEPGPRNATLYSLADGAE